jgi:hypothetical protein
VNALFGNRKKMVYVIVAFVAALLLLFAIKSRGSDLTFEGGAAMVRGETPAIGLNIQWLRAGPVGTDYELGFDLIGQSTYRNVDVSNQIVWHAMLWDGYKKAELGIGAAYFNVPSPYACQFGFTLGARWRFTDHLAAQWRHYSSAGSCTPNVGRDLLTLGWRF